jgi:hypothetical protein
VWEQFKRYFEISVYTLEGHLIMDRAAFNERLEFAKEIIEGKVKGAPAIDADVMHEEMSARGSRGKQASSKSSLSLTSRPKKRKRQSSVESQSDASASDVDSSDSQGDLEEGTLDYFENQEGK